jgi:hypothetical protein
VLFLLSDGHGGVLFDIFRVGGVIRLGFAQDMRPKQHQERVYCCVFYFHRLKIKCDAQKYNFPAQ